MKINLNKSQWEKIGRTAGWMKKSQFDEVQQAFNEIYDLYQDEQSFSTHERDIPDIEEATPEDLDAGFGKGMSGSDYQSSLQKPWVQMDAQGVYFNGNYEPSSVLAGDTRRVWITGALNPQDAARLKTMLNERLPNLQVYL